MRSLRIPAALAVAVLALAAAAARSAHAVVPLCAAPQATPAYTSFVRSAVSSGRDEWGGRLLRAKGGPTYAAARRFLAPLTNGMQWQGRPLTASGSYYVPLSFPFTPYGSTVFALHVADGSEIVTRRVGGPSLQVYVGATGSERYGSCSSHLQPAKLAQGYLPILQTAYTDARGVKYRQESFVGRFYGAYGARSVVSFVRLTVDTRTANKPATVRLVPWKRLAHASDRLSLGKETHLIVSDGAEFVQGVVRYRVPASEKQTIYALWLNAPSDAPYVHATEATYDNARKAVVSFWQKRLSGGAAYSVPEPAVQDAQLGILTQLIGFGWRYSIGNPYEELSYAESLDAAEVAAEYGYSDVAKQIVEFSLDRMRLRPWRFTAFRGSHILSTAALYHRLTHDTAFLKKETPALDALVKRIQQRQRPNGRLEPEPLSTDLEGHNADSASGQITTIVALRAIAREWSLAGYTPQAKRARAVAAKLDTALRPVVTKASTRLKDGSLFVPADLAKRKPYQQLTASRDGSYWNLVMPYAFASGWFPPHTKAARGIIRYLLGHGARLLGVPRTYARTVYGDEPGAGLAQVYGLSTSRFLADNDQPDQLVLSLYGMLAAGMTQGTYVSGEAVSVLPVRGARNRTMFMPPNSGANASFLETLRLGLVHERRNAGGAPAGLDLAFATPRGWLAPGKQIAVTRAPTSFGKVSFTLARSTSAVTGTLVVPGGSHTRLRLRLPAGERPAHVVVGGKVIAANRAGTLDLGDLHGTLALRATVT